MINDKISTLVLISNTLFIVGFAFLIVSLYLFKTDDYLSFFKMQRGDSQSSNKKKGKTRIDEKKEKINVYDTSKLSSESLSSKLEKIEKSNNEKIQSVPKRQSSLVTEQSKDYNVKNIQPQSSFVVDEDGDLETSYLNPSDYRNMNEDGDLETSLLVTNKTIEYADDSIDDNGAGETSELDNNFEVSYEDIDDDEEYTEELDVYNKVERKNLNIEHPISTDYIGSILYDDDGSDETQILSQEKIDSRVSNKHLRELINEWGSSNSFVKTEDDNVLITHTDETISS